MRVQIFINIVCSTYIYIYYKQKNVLLVKYILLHIDNLKHVPTFDRLSQRILMKYKINCQSAHVETRGVMVNPYPANVENIVNSQHVSIVFATIISV
jgi:hypothetical protein